MDRSDKTSRILDSSTRASTSRRLSEASTTSTNGSADTAIPAAPSIKYPLLNGPAEGSASRLANLYAGPQVRIQIGQGPILTLSKDLLCMQSKVFQSMFRKNRWVEGRTGFAPVEELEGVISVASFEALVQWLYRGIVNFPPDLAVSDEITKVIEFVRVADYFEVTGMEQSMALHIKSLLRRSHFLRQSPEHDAAYTRHTLPKHLRAVSPLPKGHAVRMMLAQALVTDYLGLNFKFQAELEGIQTLAYDILVATKATIGNFDGARRDVVYRDPITDKYISYGDREDHDLPARFGIATTRGYPGQMRWED